MLTLMLLRYAVKIDWNLAKISRLNKKADILIESRTPSNLHKLIELDEKATHYGFKVIKLHIRYFETLHMMKHSNIMYRIPVQKN